MTSTAPTAVFYKDGDLFVPTGLARGPWDTNAQHGGAPAALLTHLAEQAVESDFFLARLTFELTRPVPIAPLAVQVEASRGRTARRVQLVIECEGQPMGRATALMLREQPVALAPTPGPTLEPAPEDCTEGFATPGMPDGESFHAAAMDIRVARGSTRVSGPAAAWLRLQVPLVEGVNNSQMMRAAAAADFGNGLSWTLPFDEFLYANTDLTFYLYRRPVGEWIGLDSETITQPNGVGLATSTLHDAQGRIGMAHQNLLIRAR